MADDIVITVDSPEPGRLALILQVAGRVLDRKEIAYQGPVDNILLTAVDNVLQRNSMNQSALTTVQAGQGIDKNSSLYRMVESFAAAIAVASASRRGGR